MKNNLLHIPEFDMIKQDSNILNNIYVQHADI